MLISIQALEIRKVQRLSRKGVRSKRNGNARNLVRDCDIVPTHRKLGAVRKDDIGTKMQNCSVYGLASSKDNVVRYIGQTIQPLKKRLIQHLGLAKKSKLDYYCWIRNTLNEGFKIHIQLLEENCLWDEAERKWIAEYRKDYPNILLNISDGGCGYSGKRSEETKARMRKPKSESHKAAMRKPKSEETKRKMSLAQIGNTKGRGESNRNAFLCESDVRLIKKRLKNNEGVSHIAREYGVQKSAISKIKVGRTWAFIAA